KLPLGSAPAVFLPDVRVEIAEGESVRTERLLAVAGLELAAEGAYGLAEAPNPTAALAAPPGEAARLRPGPGAARRGAAGRACRPPARPPCKFSSRNTPLRSMTGGAGCTRPTTGSTTKPVPI